ncbi:MAG: MOSC domain-containing protein [Lachnospiraceae bacterium]|nr:MOSC domain-containing protein [Lachnospiraceae bacterium]
MGSIEAVCISEKKGTVKHDIGSCMVIEDYGLENDAHAGSERQVSLLSYDKVEAFKKEHESGKVSIVPGIFGENLLVKGYDLAGMSVGTRFISGDVLLELTQIGKQCHSGCEIMKTAGECIMPSNGVFAKVLKGGVISKGAEIRRVLTAAVITASDRSFRGEREDRSGPLIMELTRRAGCRVVEQLLLPDDEDAIYNELVRLSDEVMPDVIFTTGGTGFAERDRTPEATMRAAERNAPGIAEAIRAYSLGITPRAMLSRAVSVIRKKTLIVNLPGSPKAVKECLDYLLPTLEHGILILRGEADG